MSVLMIIYMYVCIYVSEAVGHNLCNSRNLLTTLVLLSVLTHGVIIVQYLLITKRSYFHLLHYTNSLY